MVTQDWNSCAIEKLTKGVMLKTNISYIYVKCQSFLSSLKDKDYLGRNCWFQIWRSGILTFPDSYRRAPHTMLQYWDTPNGGT